MTWRVEHTAEFARALRKLDRPVAARIIVAVKRLEDLDDPTARCKALSGPLKGLWRLRVGDFRVIVDIRRSELVILALDVGNRSSIYD